MIPSKHGPLAVILTDKISDRQLGAAKRAGIRVAEIRLDLFESLEPSHIFQEFRRFKGFWKIATIRSKKEGGGWSQDETKRLELFKKILPRVEAIDIELSSAQIIRPLVRLARHKKKKVLISYHDFKKTPSLATLKRIGQNARNAGADVVKIAAKVNRLSDIHALAAWTLSNPAKKVITIGMGSKGVATRLFFPLLGSVLSFTHLDTPTAHGQMGYRQMLEYFQRLHFTFDKIS